MEHWDGTKSSIVEPYPLTKHRAGQIHPRFIPAKPTDLEGNVVISPHIPGEKVCKTSKGDNSICWKEYQAINSGQLRNPSILRLRCVVSGAHIMWVKYQTFPVLAQTQKKLSLKKLKQSH